MIAASRPGYGSRECVYASTTDTFDEEADLDYIAIERALNGIPVTLTVAEKIHTARILDGRGFGTRAISVRVGSSRDAIVSWKNSGWRPVVRYSREAGWTPPRCGERRMYYKHLQAGEAACEKCKAGRRAADQRDRLAKKQKAGAANQQRSAA